MYSIQILTTDVLSFFKSYKSICHELYNAAFFYFFNRIFGQNRDLYQKITKFVLYNIVV